MQVGLHDDDEQVCQWPGCTQIDLLPATCSDCGKTFCSQHISSAGHQCPAKPNVLVATCPVCQRVVPLEFAGQDVNDAVTRHLDRGCRDAVAADKRDASATTTPSFLSRAFDRILTSGSNHHHTHHVNAAATAQTPHTSSGFAGAGRALGGGNATTTTTTTVPFCSVPGCAAVVGVRVRCDECGRVFCIDHRSPAQHSCSGTHARVRALSSTSSSTTSPTSSKSPSRSTAASKGSNSGSDGSTGGKKSSEATTTISELLQHPSNSRATARGKATERAADMCTPLVCLLLPPPPDNNNGNNNNSTATAVTPIAPFFMHVNKKFALGRVVDLAVNEAALSVSDAATAARLSARQPWQLYVVTTPVPSAAKAAMYPGQSLSTLVTNSTLATATTRAVVFVSALPALPDEAPQAVRAVQRRLN